VISGALILGEHIGLIEIGALALVLTAISLVLFSGRERKGDKAGT